MNKENIKINYTPKYPDSSCKRSYIPGSESSLSTNKDSIYNRHSIIAHYSNLGNYNLDEKYNSNYSNFYSFLNSCCEEKRNNNIYDNNIRNMKKIENIKKNIPIKNKNNINIFKNKNTIKKGNKNYNGNTTQYNNKSGYKKNEILKNYNLLKNDNFNSDIKNKTIQILSLNTKEENNNKDKEDINKYTNYIFSKRSRNKKSTIIKDIKKNNNNNINNNHNLYNTRSCNKNGKLIQKNVFKYNDNSNQNIQENNKINFDTEKKNLELIKKQYVTNTVYAQEIFCDLKNNMNNINYYQKNIIDLNDKCLKHSDLVEDNLFKYRKENYDNLKKYKPKKDNKQFAYRSLSYNTNIKKDKNINKNKKGKNFDKNKKKHLSAENIKREEIKKNREKQVNNRVLSVIKNNYDNTNMGNCLNYYNNLLKDNQEKKNLFCNQLEYKSKQIENNYIRNSHSCPYRYCINLNKGYNNENIDKNLHLKYIYHPESEINQNLIYQKMIDNDGEKNNYYINSFVFKRKNKFI